MERLACRPAWLEHTHREWAGRDRQRPGHEEHLSTEVGWGEGGEIN